MASHLNIYLILTLLVVAGVVVVSELSRKGILTPSKTPGRNTPGPDTLGPNTLGPNTLDPNNSTPSAADMTTLIIVLVTVTLVILGVFLFMKFGRTKNSSVEENENVIEALNGDPAALANLKTVHTNGTNAVKEATDDIKQTLQEAKEATRNMRQKTQDKILPHLDKAEQKLDVLISKVQQGHKGVLEELKKLNVEKEVQRQPSFKGEAEI